MGNSLPVDWKHVAFEQTPMGVFLYDRDLIILEGNEHLARMVGRPVSGLDLRTVRDSRLVSVFEEALEGRSRSFEGEYRTLTTNRTLYIVLRASPLREADGRVIGGVGVIEDITEKMADRAARHAYEQKISLFFQRVPFGFITWDADFRVIEWNESAERIFGYTAKEAIGKAAYELIVPPSVQPYIDKIWKDLTANSGGSRASNHNVRKDGQIIQCEWYNRPLVENGKVVGVVSAVDDVTERVRVVEGLRESELRFRTLIERAPNPIAVCRDYRFTYVNPALVSHLGFDQEDDIQGHLISDFVEAEDVEPIQRLIQDEQTRPPPSSRGDRYLLEAAFRKRSGGTVVWEVSAIRIEHQGLPAVLLFARDLTQQRMMQARVLETDRIVSIGTLAAGVAHEINNPIGYVLANIDAVSSRALPNIFRAIEAIDDGPEKENVLGQLGQMAEMVAMAKEGTDRVVRIVRDLRTFARSGDGTKIPLDVRKVLDASIGLALSEFKHNADVERAFDEDLPLALANDSRLGQVFLNLLVNAAQAIKEGRRGKIRVCATTIDQGNNVLISIEDNGVGISRQNLARVMEPFFTTKEPGIGTGLGLWICQGILQSLGGDLRLESEEGVGTKVFVRLPALMGNSTYSI